MVMPMLGDPGTEAVDVQFGSLFKHNTPAVSEMVAVLVIIAGNGAGDVVTLILNLRFEYAGMVGRTRLLNGPVPEAGLGQLAPLVAGTPGLFPLVQVHV